MKAVINQKINRIILIIIVVAVVFLLIFLLTEIKEKKSVSEEQLGETPMGEVLVAGDGAEGILLEENPNISNDAEIITEGVNLISQEGKVISATGLDVRTDVRYDSVLAPQQSLAISQEKFKKLDEKVIKLKVGAGAFSPNSFSVKKDEAISISLTGTDDSPHILSFIDPSLQAVYININDGETKLVVFNAPNKPGEYLFHCDFPGHDSLGETGVMIVK